MKYPKEIYVQVQGEEKDEYLQTEKSVEGLEDGKVAVYELKEMKTKKTNVSLI